MDFSRPRLHFTAREGWINDPLALTWHDDRYHLFYQYVPGQTEWGPRQRWGHATSLDLLHWEEERVVLEPGEGDGGVWSGSIAVSGDGGPAALFYTAVDLDDVQVGRARLARPVDDSWSEWVKKDVVATLPDGVDVVAFRDPYVFHDGSVWRMLMGAGLGDGTATALMYRSDDLESWSYDGLLATRHRDDVAPLWTGSVWECPQLFQLGGRWVFTVSVWEPIHPYYEAYAVGDLIDGRFHAESWGRLSYGPSYYAGSAFADRDGQRGLIYWMRDVDGPPGSWASAHSVPHVLRLDGSTVVASPHPAVADARTSAGQPLRDGAIEVSACSDIEITLDGPGSRARMTINGGEVAVLIAAAHVTVTTQAGEWTMPVDGTQVRVLIDGPVVEVFTRGGTLAVPVQAGAAARTLTLMGGAGLEVWSLA